MYSEVLIKEQQNMLIKLAMDLGVREIGFARLSCSANKLLDTYPVGISLIVPMNKQIVDKGSEQDFHQHQYDQRSFLENVKDGLAKQLKQWGYSCHSVSNQMDEDTFTGELSHKVVAVEAGLGWIGKSSLLVTPAYGPRVRIATVLTNALFAASKPRTESLCGDCRLCSDVCPARVIYNNDWKYGMGREALLDFKQCSDYRLNLVPELKRKHSCALCLKVCPWGK